MMATIGRGDWQLRGGALHDRQHRHRRRASCSTTRCCRTSPRRRRSTASRRPATRSATSAAASCSSSTSLWILQPGDVRPAGHRSPAIKLSFVSVGVWWLRLLDPAVPPRAGAAAHRSRPTRRRTSSRFARRSRASVETFRELRGYRQAFLMLVAFLLYNDGIQTIIRMASIYGAEIGIDQNAQIAAFVLVQFVGIPFSFLFGALAGRIGAKTRDLPRARRLHRHQRARLLHDARRGSSSCSRSSSAWCRAAARRSAGRSSRA